MSAGTAYSKRYVGGFLNGSAGGTPIDSTFLNAVETALLQLIESAPSADGQVMQWDFANTRYGPALLLNKNIDAAAAIAKSKIDLTGANGIVNADVAGAAAIARSKLDFGSGLVNADIATAAAIAASKLANYPNDIDQVLNGDGSWGRKIYRKVTSKTVNTTVAATDLLNAEITLAAGIMSTNKMVRLTVIGDWKQNSGAGAVGPRFQLLLGGTTLIDTGAGQSVANAATRGPLIVQAEIANVNADNAQAVRFNSFCAANMGGSTGGITGFTTGVGEYECTTNGRQEATGFNTAAVDTSVARALVLNVINGSANANYETKLHAAFIEVI